MDTFNEYYKYLMETLTASGGMFGTVDYGATGGMVGNIDGYNKGSNVIPSGGPLLRRRAKMDTTNKSRKQKKKK